MMIDNVANTRRGFAAFAAGDMDTLREVLHPDVIWNVPGRHSLGGYHRGIDAALGYFGALHERSGGTFAAELVACGEIAPDLVSCLVKVTGAMPGGAIDQMAVFMFTFEDGRGIEVLDVHEDQYAFDAAVDGQITLPDARTATEAASVKA